MGIDKKLEQISRVTGATGLNRPNVQSPVQPPLVAQAGNIPLVHRADGFYDDIPWEEARYCSIDGSSGGWPAAPMVDNQTIVLQVPDGMVLDINSVVFRVPMSYCPSTAPATAYNRRTGVASDLPRLQCFAHDGFLFGHGNLYLRISGVTPVDRRLVAGAGGLPAAFGTTFMTLNQDVLHPQVGSHIVAREGQTVETGVMLFFATGVNLGVMSGLTPINVVTEMRGRWIPSQYYNRMRQEFRQG
jgi:hypothetical protein